MFQFSPIFKQFLTIVCCNLLTLSYGLTTGWATINFNELQSESSTFSTGPLSIEELSLVIGIVNLGAVGNFLILPASQVIGIKKTIHLFGLPLILSAILIIWAQNVYYLYASRVLTGLVGGALSVGLPTLINDISSDNMRGALNSIYDPFNNIGIIISFFIGNYLSCIDQAKTLLIGPIIFISIMFLLPESPEFLANRNKQKRAMKARKFYKGSFAALESAEFLQKTQIEIEKGKLEKDEEEEDEDDESDSKLTLQDFLTPQAKKAIFISFMALALNFASGTMVIMSYVTDIFTKTGSSLSTKNSSLLVSITQITANVLFLNCVERINRRALQICSSLLTTASFFLFAAYCLLWIDEPELNWMPPFCFACIIYFSWMGQIPIPFIVTFEIFPKKIRQTCLSLSVSLIWIISFILGSIFPVFLESFGLFTTMMTFGVISLLNVLFGIFFIPETRGKSYEEIMSLLSNNDK
ncbi:facilitated trehalose transporter Tret1-like isoform X2 [Sitodiplosis mosellana]|uniref:facilitated trehalose transporter Tret1-like isoform X2 n=1 Tax=Sitodiplosis mosellana TaxID=263140 RepID=UPI0024452879|nr:facilitated trehalose transporter Tret1-like isoform X2 [Sitodiplosis mosellana]